MWANIVCVCLCVFALLPMYNAQSHHIHTKYTPSTHNPITPYTHHIHTIYTPYTQHIRNIYTQDAIETAGDRQRRKRVGTSDAPAYVAGLCLPKALGPLLPIFLQGILQVCLGVGVCWCGYTHHTCTRV